ncbi:MAG: hypothetical protein K9H49_10800 [Bacteroidales bacterium]|nr:hypothetical protein [Bacteroidales bacterium]MCF8406013.1 hypothetical protein [Bacteroidales bacterium]
MRKLFFLSLILIFSGCNFDKTPLENHSIFINDVLNNESSFYHLTYHASDTANMLPIGVFDSGIGGLTVFEAIINSDNFNLNKIRQPDGKKDFINEYFIYLADQANMPYSNYVEIGKPELLEELSLKDALFLVNNKYNSSPLSSEISYDKPSVKTIVIACNTATAYGKNLIEDFLEHSGVNIKVLGVVDAGVNGALEGFKKDESGVIAVFATPATVKSEVYVNSLLQQIKENDYNGKIEFVQQGGKGLHESIDNKEDFIRENILHPSLSYKGPSYFDEQFLINKELLQTYNFDTSDFKMVYNGENIFVSDTIQINSIENYVRYHIVSLVEKIRLSGTKLKLKSVILGCTHYPFVKDEINEVLSELRENEAYRTFLSPEISLIDPADNLAIELYEHLSENNLLFPGAIDQKGRSSFYLTVPNTFISEVETTSEGVFSYDYQYLKREINSLVDHTLSLPFSREVISASQLEQIEKKLPATYELIAPVIK